MKWLLVLVGLVALASPAMAKDRYRDEKVKYFFQVDDDLYLTMDMPRMIFLTPQWRIDGNPGPRRGSGAFFVQVSHPRSRGIRTHIHVELMDQDGLLADFAKDYHDRAREITAMGMMDIVGEPTDLDKTKIKVGKSKVTAYKFFYNARATNALNSPVTGSCAAYILDFGKKRVVLCSESLWEGIGPGLVETALGSATKLPKDAEHFKMIDQTSGDYRYMTFDLPKGWRQDFSDEFTGHFAQWLSRDDSGHVQVALELRGLMIAQQPLETFVESSRGAIASSAKEVSETRLWDSGLEGEFYRFDVVDNAKGRFNDQLEDAHTSYFFWKDETGFCWSWRLSVFKNNLDEDAAAKLRASVERDFMKMLQGVTFWVAKG